MGLFSFFFFYFSLVLTSQFFFLWSNSMLPEPKNPKCPHQHVGVPLLQGAQPPSSPWGNSCILKVWLLSRHHQTSRTLTFNLHKIPRLHFRFLELLPTCHTTLLPRSCSRISLDYVYISFLAGSQRCRWARSAPSTTTAMAFSGQNCKSLWGVQFLCRRTLLSPTRELRFKVHIVDNYLLNANLWL